MGYKTLFIRDSDKLSLYIDNLMVTTNDSELRFLISDLKLLIIDNYKAVLSSQLINKLTNNNVSLLICDLAHLPCSQLISLNGHYATSGIIMKQIKWNEKMKARLHKYIVKAKINSQIKILQKNNLNSQVIDKIKKFKEEVEDDDISNREGLVAKMYFRELFGTDFIRFDDDIYNAGLNYGYAIFRSLISTIIVSKGLLLNLGIFHKGHTNNTNLADDIIEVYRPIVDDHVFNNFQNKELLLRKDKEDLIRLLDKKVSFNGNMHTITNSIEMYVESIINCFEKDDDTLFVAPDIGKINDL